MLDKSNEVEIVEPPIGASCLYCEELIVGSDQGVVMPFFDSKPVEVKQVFQHRECFLRHVFGSVGHQLKTCSCFGGTQEDPEGLSRRDAAKAAVELFELNHKWGIDWSCPEENLKS